MTGQGQHRLPFVVVKELIDNALDICEASNIPPEIEIVIGWADICNRFGNPLFYISVKDNGKGFPLEIIKKILNFSTRTSDKEVYKAPTRGAQGNAFKTILGIPIALRDTSDNTPRPIIIESLGEKHIINISIDQILQEPNIDIQSMKSNIAEGAKVTVFLDMMKWYLNDTFYLDITKAVQSYALFNPHASFRLSICPEGYDYKKIIPATILDYKKFTPRDLTSPHWYTAQDFERLVLAYIKHSQNNGNEKSLREFISEFKNTSKKESKILKELPDIRYLTDFTEQRELIKELLIQMQSVAKKPAPQVLGILGKDHFRQAINTQFGLVSEDSFNYKLAEGEFQRNEATIPYVIEMVSAKVKEAPFGIPMIGLNNSIVYDNPFNTQRERFEYLTPKEDFEGYGLDAFLNSFKISSSDNKLAVVIHLLCPNLEYTDRSKSHIVVAPFVKALSEAVYHTCKDYYREKKREEKAERREWRREEEWHRESKRGELSIKEAVFKVLPEAISQASGNGKLPFSVRSLYYKVRPLLQEYTDKKLNYDYFTPDLLTQYQDRYGVIPGLYYDPRGFLKEPHSETHIPLGTRDVDQYRIPEYRYNKILYIEKKGFFAVLDKARILDRYDMAVVAGEGYGTRAIKEVLSKADKDSEITIYCIHDCDQDGFRILRTLREETRTSKHRIEIVDFGLRPQEVWERSLLIEEVIYKKAPEVGLYRFVESGELTEEEYDWLVGEHTGRRNYKAERCELDALGSQGFVDWLEKKLEEYGAEEKVIPPQKVLDSKVKEEKRGHVKESIEDILDKVIKVNDIINEIYNNIKEEIPDIDNVEEKIKGKFEDDPTHSWDSELNTIVDEEVDKGLEDIEAEKKIKAQLLEIIRGKISDLDIE